MAEGICTQNQTSVKERFITKWIKEVADVETVAEYLDLDIKKHGRRSMILCPCHDDHNYGSCFLTEHGFVCYSCHAHGDVIALVQAAKGIPFSEACELICGIYGKSSDFKERVDRPRKKVLDEKSLRLIGIPRSHEAVWKIKGAIDPYDSEELERNQQIKWMPIKVDEDAICFSDEEMFNPHPCEYYVLQELVLDDPLQNLLDSDEQAYNELIRRKASEAAERYRSMLDMAQNPAKYYRDEDISGFMIAYWCNVISESVGSYTWNSVLQQMIRKCDDIRIEFTTEKTNLTEERKEQKRPNIFGKIKTSSISI